MKQNALCWNRRPFPTFNVAPQSLRGQVRLFVRPKRNRANTCIWLAGLITWGSHEEKHRDIFCLFFLIISSLSAQNAPWEKTAGPPGLEVTVVYETNNILYAGTATQGVYRSTDNGISWIAANGGIELTQVHDLIASGGNLLAATSSKSFICPGANNVFKSTDNGSTWSPTSGLSAHIVTSFAIKGSFVYAGFAAISGSGIFRSSR